MKLYSASKLAPHSEKYPLAKAKNAKKSLKDLIDEVDNSHAAHFTDSEWKTLAEAYDILNEYVYDISH